MLPFVESLVRQVTLSTVLDIAITALFIYWVFSLIRGTRAVTLVIGVSILLGVYALAQFLELRLFTQLLQAGAVVGLFALVVVFQPELRRALERIGRVGTLGWLFAPAADRRIEHVAGEVAKAAANLSREGHGALLVIERETGLEEIAETGVMLHADLSTELLLTIFAPRTALHDGAVIIRGDSVLAAGALLPLTDMTLSQRFGTRHRAALGITEDTDAVAIVVSEENGQMSLVERARIVRVPTEAQLARALAALLEAPAPPAGLGGRGATPGSGRSIGRLRISRRRSLRSEFAPATGLGAAEDGAAAGGPEDGAAGGGPEDGAAAGGQAQPARPDAGPRTEAGLPVGEGSAPTDAPVDAVGTPAAAAETVEPVTPAAPAGTVETVIPVAPR
jgi:diadenylate cyclase